MDKTEIRPVSRAPIVPDAARPSSPRPPETALFASLMPQPRKAKPGVIVASAAAHVVILAIAVYSAKQIVRRAAETDGPIVFMLSPPPPAAPAPRPFVPEPPRRVEPKLEIPKPRPAEPAPEPPKPEPAPEPPRAEPPKPAPPPPPAPKPVVKTNVFATEEPVKPAPVLARDVRSGSFETTVHETKAAPVLASARAGGFDVAAAPAAGPPRGEARVAATGFDTGPARGIPASSVDRGSVRAGAFGDARPVEAAAARAKPKPAGNPDQPVQILSKPKPSYTEEARALRLEGDVELEVLFTADGKLRIVRVLRGLGHGLDEAAIEAARKITFAPARRDGVPVDYAATLRVVFQLA